MWIYLYISNGKLAKIWYDNTNKIVNRGCGAYFTTKRFHDRLLQFRPKFSFHVVHNLSAHNSIRSSIM